MNLTLKYLFSALFGLAMYLSIASYSTENKGVFSDILHEKHGVNEKEVR